MNCRSLLNRLVRVDKQARRLIQKRCYGTNSQNVPQVRSNVPVPHNDYYNLKENNEEWETLLQVFATKNNQLLGLHKIKPLSLSAYRIREWTNGIKREVEIMSQKYISERHAVLGSDLATAHFIVFRGGKVKFHHQNNWIQKDINEEICKDLPNRFVPNWYLECIDASHTKLRYEGLVNFTNLNRLKWLSLENCEFVDDWFLDRLTGEFSKTLEYLNISNCRNVTENGLSCFYRLQNLKTLVLGDIVKTKTFEFSCILLEDAIPNLNIEGVKYIDVN